MALDPAVRRQLARRRALARQRRQAQFRRRRLVAAATVVVVALACVLAATSGGPGPAQRAAGQLVALPRLRALVGSRLVVPGRLPALAWPAQGEGAAAVRGIGLMGASAHQRVVPIASLTKMMTAYVILHDHPLAPGEPGPVVTMTAADVAAYGAAWAAGDSSVPVRAGERLSELQLLEALLIPSADNIADLLGRWDAGSDAAFVERMNATARSLGLAHTHYADASGVDPGSRSTAADQARLAADLMGLPVVRSIVRNPSLPFPVARTVTNYNPALGTDGVVGVKSGFTGQAQACLATAAYRQVGGRSVLVIAVALGQPGGLNGAARADLRLLSSASRALVAVPADPGGGPVAAVFAPWTSQRTTAELASEGMGVGWPGLVLERLVKAVPLPVSSRRTASAGAASHQVVGSLALEAPWGTEGSVPLVAARALRAPAG